MADVDGGHKIYISEPSRHHGFGGGLKQQHRAPHTPCFRTKLPSSKLNTLIYEKFKGGV